MLEKQISKGDVANYGFNAGGAPLSFDFRIAGHSAPMPESDGNLHGMAWPGD